AHRGNMEQTFRAVTRNPGIIIWRIELKGAVSFNIHYWIGSESSQDEQGAAAVYTIQLDEFLGSTPVQNEARRNQLLQYSKTAPRQREQESGRQRGEPRFSKVLLFQVEVSWNSFNLGDVFLLDLGKTIVQWNGPKSNKQERLKGMLLAKDIRDRERGGRVDVRVIEGDAEGSCSQNMQVMNSVLGERSCELTDGQPDEVVDQETKANLTLYCVSDEDGQMTVTEVATRPLVQDLLNHDDCYILDQGGAKIFVWKGKKANKAERQAAMSRALDFIKAKNYPITTNVEVVNDGAESALFQQLFQRWTVKNQTKGLGKVNTKGKVAHITQEKFDATLMHTMPEVAAQERMVDNGTGQVEVWRIEDLELVPVDPKTYGYFYGGDCYLILYTYLVNSKKCYLLYIWQGRHATQDELAASAFQAVNLDQKYNDEPVQVRVTMGKEPRHFMAMFKGKMVIFEGGTSRKGSSEPEPPVRLFQVHGFDSFNTKTIEVPALASSLNSNDVFLLSSNLGIFLWCGKGSSGDERAMAKEVSAVIGKGSQRTFEEIVAEGQEPFEFWEFLGGKAPYASEKRLQQVVFDHAPRLFECSNKTGRFIVSEITQFTQDDLCEDDVMLLDTWDQLFLWIGKEANEQERKEAVTTSREYLITHPGDRDPDTPIVLIKQGFEPPTFTGWFTAWDPTKWRSNSRVVNSIIDPQNKCFCLFFSQEEKNPEKEKVFQSFSLDLLQNKKANELPQGVNPSEREKHLSEADFLSLFSVTKEDFEKMPQWKQAKLKKEKGLF
uniref:Advillin n=1 Tax=Nothobranchius furzeri TaxID=105023 RepID=A0A8C6L4Y3_NOTFU